MEQRDAIEDWVILKDLKEPGFVKLGETNMSPTTSACQAMHSRDFKPLEYLGPIPATWLLSIFLNVWSRIWVQRHRWCQMLIKYVKRIFWPWRLVAMNYQVPWKWILISESLNIKTWLWTKAVLTVRALPSSLPTNPISDDGMVNCTCQS